MPSFRPGGMSDSEGSDDEFFFNRPPPTTAVNPKSSWNPDNTQNDNQVDISTETARHNYLYTLALQEIQNGDETLKNLEAALKAGLDIHHPNKGWTFLHHACKAGSPKLISYLIQKGADVDYISDSDGFPPFLALTLSDKRQNIPLMKECLGLLASKKGASSLRLKEMRDITPVMFAAKENLPELVQVFVDFGVDVNEQDYDGMTALHLAAEFGYGKVIRVLLQHGAKVDLVNEDGQTPYDIAASKKYFQLASDLYQVRVTNWIPGSDPSLLNNLRDPDLTEIATPKQQLLRPQRALIDMTLDRIGHAELIPIFNQHKLNFLAFLRLTDSDLQTIGIQEFGTRVKILDSVRVLHNAEWNKTSIHSMFLQGNITCPEVVCMLNDIKTHLDFMTQSMTYLRNRLEAEPHALISGSECTRAPELARFTVAAIESSKTWTKEAESLVNFFQTAEGRSELKLGDLIEQKSTNSKKWYVSVAFLISALLVTAKLRCFNPFK